jgi:hypothetical protein
MFNERRQPSCGGTSRMTRECHVRFCERLGVQFPGPTRHLLRFGSVSMGGLPPPTTEWRAFENGRNVPQRSWRESVGALPSAASGQSSQQIRRPLPRLQP